MLENYCRTTTAAARKCGPAQALPRRRCSPAPRWCSLHDARGAPDDGVPLSFPSIRPLVQDCVRLRIQVPAGGRATMWASFDGRDRRARPLPPSARL